MEPSRPLLEYQKQGTPSQASSPPIDSAQPQFASSVSRTFHALLSQREHLKERLDQQNAHIVEHSRTLTDSVIHKLLMIHKQRHDPTRSAAFTHYENAIRSAAVHYKAMKTELREVFQNYYQLGAVNYSCEILQQLSTAVNQVEQRVRVAPHHQRRTQASTSSQQAIPVDKFVASPSPVPPAVDVNLLLQKLLAAPPHVQQLWRKQRRQQEKLQHRKRLQRKSALYFVDRRADLNRRPGVCTDISAHSGGSLEMDATSQFVDEGHVCSKCSVSSSNDSSDESTTSVSDRSNTPTFTLLPPDEKSVPLEDPSSGDAKDSLSGFS